MPAKIIDGTKIAAEIREELKQRVAKLKEKGITPGLAAVLVGDDPASISYVAGKKKGAEEVGIYAETFHLPADTPEDEVVSLVSRLNKDPKFHGILVQLPLPKHIREEKIIEQISPDKDVDAFHPVNVGKLLRGEECLLPCTPHGIQQLLVRSGYNPEGKHVVIVGRSNIVGKPLAAMLIQKKKNANATVTVCHTGTKNLSSITRQADILVAAMGSAQFIKADMVKEGAVVIDVGVNRIPDPTKKSGFRLVGDTDFEALKDKVEAITPVPGGVGPMTVTMLLYNTIEAAERQLAK